MRATELMENNIIGCKWDISGLLRLSNEKLTSLFNKPGSQIRLELEELQNSGHETFQCELDSSTQYQYAKSPKEIKNER